MVEIAKVALETLKEVISNLRRGKPVSSDPRNDNITLKIVNNNKIIAFLTTKDEGNTYTLTYTKDFLYSGIPSFNLEKNEMPEPGFVYESDTLWYSFTSRLPSPTRNDFVDAMNRAGLTGEESYLEILGRLSKFSISKSWSIELDSAA